jgi:hypothetical protein
VENIEHRLVETAEQLGVEIRQNAGKVSVSLDELKRWYADDNVGRLCERLERTEVEMRKSEIRTEERITQAFSEIKEFYHGLLISRSWYIGWAITWLPRKIKNLFRHK